jgi:hypothetical protein
MPRFVVLQHETPSDYHRRTHFDLMLESAGALKTWAMDSAPIAGSPAMAERLADHRIAYLNYEGEISGGRGSVRRIDHGEYTLLEESPDRLVIDVQGQYLQGTLTLSLDNTTHLWRVSLSAV